MKAFINRRDFLKTGAVTVAGTAILPHLVSGCTSGPAQTGNGHHTLNDFLNHFGVTQQMIKQVISEGLSKGGDYCDVYFQHIIGNYIGLEDNAVNRAYSNVSFGVGIRVLKGDQTGYSFSEEISIEAMKSAARTAANIATSSAKVAPIALESHKLPNYYTIKTPWEEISINEKIPYLQKVNEKVFALDSRIIKSNVSFTDETSYVLFANSEGRITFDYLPMGQIAVSCIAEQDGQKESNYYDFAGRRGIEFFTPETIDKLASEAVKRTTILFDAVKPKAGEMPVVLAAGSSGILLHEAIGHGMEADFNRKEISIFSDKIGKKVAKDFVTIVDDGTNPNIRGSINVDDEGNDTECTYLVENGTMRSYLHDRISAKHYGVKPTGNGRRESFRHNPIPRMRNTYMKPGPHKKNEIIESVKYGIYAESFTNGQVMIGAGDFTFYVKSGYLIEDGKLTRPIKDINIIGNGPDVLSDITMVGDDLKMAEGGWTCGKNGQGVPVSQGLPTVKVSKITVGGVNA
ncbi:twin-arginine translocation signal domain-containing protein [Marinilabiliaceae bacterium JC017]|nr:twin-arginine translocation signal domain-containing protein [Marinilabiliaceae bacterium JC017]